ncbi:ABC transporter permease [Alkalibacillus haloalkaliphilus]|uniref:ABC transporter permease n=1 Tax=Alkalibacillus haloalkaliphilus TaxID=94136 RepID=UPI002936B048|nr:ABC transporter permease [Alkalibacillus haloalkaliphilus]MDV2582485.1 ABC transporter permease [Alkalibacillus haloalkaliphilus]
MVFTYSLFELKRILKSPVLLLFVISLPIAIVLIVGMVIYQSVQSELEDVSLIVIDEDQTFETNTLIQQLENDETLAEHVEFLRKDGVIDDYVGQQNVAAIIRVPEGFTSQLRSGVNEPIDVYLNERQPFASQLGYLLLKSGQDYITAAQSGVNTVNHYLGSQMSDDERRDLVQQMTVHFTLLTLGRNSLFVEHNLAEMNTLAWEQQAYVGVVSLLYVLTLLFFNFLFKPKAWHGIEERFTIIRLTEWKRSVSEFIILFSMSVLYMIIFALIIPNLVTEINILLLLVQWGTIAAIFCLLYLLLDHVIKVPAFTLMVFSFLSISSLFISGLILPNAFLPEWAQSSVAYIMNQSFYTIISEGEIPVIEWLVMGAVVFLLFLLLWLGTRRGEALT